MRVAALYDIHGNLPALDAVLDDIREEDVDEIVVGGDVVLGPIPADTLERLLNLDIAVQFIAGNCDREVISRIKGQPRSALPPQVQEAVTWVAEQLHPRYDGLLESWPKSTTIDIRGLGPVLFCHATPRNDVEIFTRRTPEDRLLQVFDGIEPSVVVCGHTHMQFDRMVGTTRVVNAGSVGMPFGGPGADWLLLGPDVQLRHTSYDLAGAAAAIRGTSYPRAQDFADNNVLSPPTEEKMLEAFAGIELK